MQRPSVLASMALPRRSLDWRLFGSFALALVALAVVGGLSIWQLQLDFLGFQRTGSSSTRATMLAYRIRIDYLDAHRNIKDALLRGDDPEMFRTYSQRFDDDVQRIRDLRAQLDELVPTLTDQERLDLAAFDRDWSLYLRAWSRATELFREAGGSNARAADLWMRGKEDNLEAALADLTHSLSQRRRAAARASLSATQASAERVSVLFGLTALVGLLIALVAARSLVRAMRQSGAVAQAAKFRALGQLAGGVAHDVNQSLSIIAGYGELAFDALSRPQPDLVRAREGLDLITRAAVDAGETIARLLRFTRATPDGPAERVEMGDLLADVAKLTAPRWRDSAQTEGRTITVEVATTGDTAVIGWPSRLREALTNLVLNAVDALPQGGTIRLWARRAANVVEVGVSDDGVGMSADVKAHVFEPFFTTKGERGTGLGLAVVFGVVEQHGGQIEVDSAPGQGTTFHLRLPSAPAEAEFEPEPEAAATPAGRVLRVLALDDEPALARLMALMLRRHGHCVTVAETTEEALRRLDQDAYDLVVSDLGLGQGMDGWELADEVRRRWPGTRFVLATGWGAEIDAAAARRRGVDAVINKPYRLRDLERVVELSV